MFIDDEIDERELESRYHLYLERIYQGRITRIMIIIENDTCYINTHRGYFVELPNNEYHKIACFEHIQPLLLLIHPPLSQQQFPSCLFQKNLQ